MITLVPKQMDLPPWGCLHESPCTGAGTVSIDGSGIVPSVNELEAQQLLRFIHTQFSCIAPLRLVDIGAGIGRLQAEADLDATFEARSVEGAMNAWTARACVTEHLALCDIARAPLRPEWTKQFHLSTSFEFFEHVHRDDLDRAIANIATLSDYHLCSVHCGNEEHSVHCTIRPPTDWQDHFERVGAQVTLLGNYPISSDAEREPLRQATGLSWELSAFFLVQWPEELLHG